MSSRRLRPVALLVLLGLAAGLAPAARALDDPAARTRITRLDNGLVVLTLEDATTPVVSFQMWVKVGSRDEARYSGLAHLFEHLMFKGSEHIGPEEHARLVAARGGEANAYTNRDFTVFYDDVTAESLPLVIDLEHERVAHLDISEHTLDGDDHNGERQVVLEERRLRTEDQPMGRAYEALLALTWQAHPYRRPVIGWRSDVEAATVDVCRRFFHTYYAPNNLVISIVGDFDADTALDHIRRTFGRLEPVPDIPRNPTKEPEQDGERRETVTLDLRSPILAAAWHAPPSGSDDGEPLDVLSTILSDGRSSRLYRRLVYEEQQALSAQGGYWELRDSGVFLAIAGVRPDASIDRVEKSFFEEIDKLKAEPVGAEELEKAKRQLEVGLVEQLRTSHALGARIAEDFALFGRIRPLEERLRRIRAVSAADVQRVARKYLDVRDRSVVHVVPPADGAGS